MNTKITNLNQSLWQKLSAIILAILLFFTPAIPSSNAAFSLNFAPLNEGTEGISYDRGFDVHSCNLAAIGSADDACGGGGHVPQLSNNKGCMGALCCVK